MKDTKKMIEKWFKSGDVLVVEKGGGVIGYLYGERRNHSIYEVKYIGVKKQYHRRGIGTALILKVKEMAKKKGFRKLGLFVEENNEKAISFYRKLGFLISGFIVDYYSWHSSAIFLTIDV